MNPLLGSIIIYSLCLAMIVKILKQNGSGFIALSKKWTEFLYPILLNFYLIVNQYYLYSTYYISNRYFNMDKINQRHIVSVRNKNKLQFGLSIPQGWRRGELPLNDENNPVKQYEFSKIICTLAEDLNFNAIYAYDHLIPHYSDDIEKNIFEGFTMLTALTAITKK